MTTLVTGGSGLVGSHVIDALRARGERVRALVRRESRSIVEQLGAEAVIGDVTDPETWQRAMDGGIDRIVHSAALVVTSVSWDEYIRVNVGGTRLALEMARQAGARLVYVSTVAVYGRTVSGVATIDEEFPFQPLSPHDFYARSKRAAEQLVREAATRDGLSVAAIRPNVIYGERDRLFTERLVATARRPGRIIPQIGPGTNHLSCVYVGNVAAAIVAALDAPPRAGFRAYNVTRDAQPWLTHREFLHAFAEALGVPVRFIRVPTVLAQVGFGAWTALRRVLRPGRYAGLGAAAVAFLLGENTFSTSRIQNELLWTPPFATREAVARAARSFAAP